LASSGCSTTSKPATEARPPEGWIQAGQDLDGCRFARAVRAEESQNLARLDRMLRSIKARVLP
jgi:hypothetical protein